MASLLDIFSTQPAQNAANAQIGGLQQGYANAAPQIQGAINTLNLDYSKALQPFLTNYKTATAGTNQLSDVLGLSPGGMTTALSALRNTPGYQFQLQQGNDAINAAAAASGQLGTGNQQLALAKYNQGLADTTYNNYVSQLQPFLNYSQGAASGIGNLYSGLGNAVAGQYGNLANLGWNEATGIGNAQANADLSAYNASGNMWGALLGAGKLGASALGSGGASSLFGGFGGAAAAPSTVAAGIPAIFSDFFLKEGVEPVGELYDGTGVYRYRYVGDDTPRIGLIAQEVEAKHPDAVIEHPSGFKMVDYERATDAASLLARFSEPTDNVVPFPSRSEKVTDLFARFLEAA